MVLLDEDSQRWLRRGSRRLPVPPGGSRVSARGRGPRAERRHEVDDRRAQGLLHQVWQPRGVWPPAPGNVYLSQLCHTRLRHQSRWIAQLGAETVIPANILARPAPFAHSRAVGARILSTLTPELSTPPSICCQRPWPKSKPWRKPPVHGAP